MTEHQKDQLRPGEADGIQEFDNKMPRWWVLLFYISTIIGVVYAVYIHGFGGETLIAAYDKTLTEEAAQKLQAESAPDESGNSGPSLADKMKTAAYIEAGKPIYDVNCAPCHGPDGGGSIGPNFTDKYWLHGGKPEDVMKVISDGVIEKGMIAWMPILGKQKIEEVAAYVLSLQGTTPTNPKEPQGTVAE